MSIKLPYRLTPSPCANTQSYSLAVNSSNASKATSSSRELLELASSKQRSAEFVRFSISGMTPPIRNPPPVQPHWLESGAGGSWFLNEGIIHQAPFAHSPTSGQIETSWEASSSLF